MGTLEEIEDLYNNAPCGFHSLDKNGVFVRVNETELRWLGYTRNELIGKNATDVLAPESVKILEDNFARFIVEGSLRDLELQMIRKDGSLLPVLVSATAVRDPQGNFVMSRSILYDISERKRQDQKFRGLLEAAPDAMVVMNPDGRIALANAQTERMFGYQREELLDQHVEMLLPERYRQQHTDHRTDYFRQPKVRPMGAGLELYGRRKDGTEFPVEISLSPLQTDDGYLAVSAIRDITDRKRMDEALRESEERFRRVFEEGPLGLALVARDGRFLKVNSALCRMVGYSEPELIATSLAGLTHPDDRQTDVELAKQLFYGEIPFYQIPKRYVKNSGEIIWVDLTRSKIRDSAGTPLYALVMIEDITERRRADEALRVSEERFRVALKNAPVTVFNQDHRLRYIWINSAVMAWAAEDYFGRTDAEIVGGEEGARLMAIKQEVLQRGIGTRTETAVTFMGETRHFDLTVEPLRDAQGVVVGVTCAAIDVTALKQAVAEREVLIGDLKEALARVKMLSGLLPICAWCKKIRDEQGAWSPLETYISLHSEADFTHGMCPDCLQSFGWATQT